MVNAAAIAVPVGVVVALAALAGILLWVLRSRKRTAKQHTVLPTSTLTKPASSKQAMILDTGSHLPVAEDETRPSRTTSTRAVYDCIVTTGQSTISEAGAVAVSMDPEALESRDMTSAHDGSTRVDKRVPAAEDILKTMSDEKISLHSTFQATQAHQKQCCTLCNEYIAMGHTIAWLPCEHVFHHKCIGQWLNSCRSCPACHIMLTTHTLEDVGQEGQWHQMHSSDRR